MKRHLQCAEQHWLLSNITKYCACHEILSSRCQRKIPDSAMIRAWSEDKIVISHPPLRRPYSSNLGDAFCMEKYNISRSGYLPKCHEILRLPRKVTLQLHQILCLPRKMNLMIDPRHIWNVIYKARSNTGYCPTSPNTAPATKFWVQDVSGKSLSCFRQYKDDSTMIRAWSEHDPKIKSSSRTRRFGDLTRPILETHFVWKNTTFRAPAISQNVTKSCACHEKSHSNFTKYCACHAKWTSWHLFSLGIYSLSASILSWHLFSLGIYSL